MLDSGRLPSSQVITGLASSCSIQPPGRRLLDIRLVAFVEVGKGWEGGRGWVLVALFVDSVPFCFGEGPDHDAHVD